MTQPSTIALVACLGSTLFMTGLIWFVQAVHYPLFGQIGPAHFRGYHSAHSRRTTSVVLGPMVVEILSSAALLFWRPPAVPPISLWLGLLLSVATWASTAAVQVPLHGRLSGGFDAAVVARLVQSNLVRSAAWSFHAALLLWIVARMTPC